MMKPKTRRKVNIILKRKNKTRKNKTRKNKTRKNKKRYNGGDITTRQRIYLADNPLLDITNKDSKQVNKDRLFKFIIKNFYSTESNFDDLINSMEQNLALIKHGRIKNKLDVKKENIHKLSIHNFKHNAPPTPAPNAAANTATTNATKIALKALNNAFKNNTNNPVIEAIRKALTPSNTSTTTNAVTPNTPNTSNAVTPNALAAIATTVDTAILDTKENETKIAITAITDAFNANTNNIVLATIFVAATATAETKGTTLNKTPFTEELKTLLKENESYEVTKPVNVLIDLIEKRRNFDQFKELTSNINVLVTLILKEPDNEDRVENHKHLKEALNEIITTKKYKDNDPLLYNAISNIINEIDRSNKELIDIATTPI